MRAIFDPDFNCSNPIVEDADKVHHLNKVLRLKKGEQVLVLTGKGQRISCSVKEVQKKKIFFEVEKQEELPRTSWITIALAVTKKDALDTNLKQAVELGAKKIVLIFTEYSQNYDIKQDRIERLLIAALEQCNEVYLPEVEIWQGLEEVKNYKHPIAFISEIETTEETNLPLDQDTLVIIGPEGGFSPVEIKFLGEHAQCIKLKTNILRSTTALPMAIGYLHGKCH